MLQKFGRSFVLIALTISSLGCSAHIWSGRSDYPKSWWVEVPREDAVSWEVLPQDARKGEVILSKRTALGIFSNFASTSFTLDNEVYASVEGFWQMMKYPDGKKDIRLKDQTLIWPYTRDQVKQLTGFTAKEAGDQANTNMEILGITWVTYKGRRIEYKDKGQDRHYKLIEAAIRAKVLQNPEVAALLMKTKGLQLMPDHVQDPEATPAYRYHEILMKIRDEK